LHHISHMDDSLLDLRRQSSETPSLSTACHA
jgi:hypothetical protein